MASLLQLGVNSLNVNKARLNTIGNNISNASTPGYSRQEVTSVTAPSQQYGQGYLGGGVLLEGVRRVYDSFLSGELRTNSSSFQQYDTLVAETQKIDNFLGDEKAGLSPSLQQFFAAVQDAASNPQATSSRQTLLSQANLLVNRFHASSERLDEVSNSVNTQLTDSIAEINTLSTNLARLNVSINAAGGSNLANQPNDLLDKRDQLLLKLSEFVAVNPIENADGSVNVFVGNGQALVIGSQSFALSAEARLEDPQRMDLVLTQGNSRQVVTGNLAGGGSLGGLIDFSQTVLYDAYDQLGRVSLGLNQAMNEQHRNGLNLRNETGVDFFTDLNSVVRQQNRVLADPDNSPLSTGSIQVAIAEASELTASAYEVEFSSSDARSYTVTRLNDGKVMANNLLPLNLPTTLELDGLEIQFAEGSFQTGDKFTLYPTRFESAALDLAVSDVRDLALAQPLKTSATLGNRGSGVISAGEVTDTSSYAFDAANKALSPPLLIRFISNTRYEVLDNSDPSAPKELIPPLSQQTFVPGQSNLIFPTSEGETAVSSLGDNIGVAQVSLNNNGYAAESIQITRIDPDTQVLSRQTITTAANDSATTIANTLNNLDGVKATAITRATLSNIQSSTPLNVTFNDQLLSGSTPSALAASINNNTALTQQGIRATTDGMQIVITSDQGVDFNFQVGGASANDSIDITGMDGNLVQIDALDATPAVTVGGRVDLILDKGVSVQGQGNVIAAIPTVRPTDRGYQVNITGVPVSGDTFSLTYNTNGFADNRNAVAMGALQTTAILQGESVTLQGGIANLVNQVATLSQESAINRDASETLLTQVQEAHAATSGVNLDEEAAKLIEFELAYNASAQLITVAKNIFDTLLNAVG